MADDAVDFAAGIGMDVIDVGTNFVGVLAMSQIIQEIDGPMDIIDTLMKGAPDARLSFLIAGLYGMQEARVMAASRPLIPATYYAFMRGVALTGSLIGIWSHIANYTGIKKRTKEDLGNHIAVSALMGGTTSALTVLAYKAG
jgi:hypothetical protein